MPVRTVVFLRFLNETQRERGAVGLKCDSSQEAVLLNLPATKGKAEIHEKRLRPIAAMLNWAEQRAAWSSIRNELVKPS